MPLAIAAVVAWGGYSLYKEGAFRKGVGGAVNHVLHKIPYFGSRFGHYRGSRKSVARSKKSYSKHGKKARSRYKASRRRR